MISAQLDGLEDVNHRLATIANPRLRKKIIRAVAKVVRKNSIKRAVQQKNVDGTSFKKHAKNRKRKMLTRVARRMKVFDVNDDRGYVAWKNQFEAVLAGKHHRGFTQRITASNLTRNTIDGWTGKDATRRQARALIDGGYKVRKKGRAKTTPTIKWIISNLNRGRAGVIIRVLRDKAKTEWDTVLPERFFLGASINDADELNQLITDLLTKSMAKN